MGTITAITRQKRNKERVNIFIDDSYAFSLAEITAVRLHTGQELTDEDIARLDAEDSLEKAKQSAYRFLSYRPRSTAEVRQNLLGKGYSEEVVEQALIRLTELDLLNDREFARYWIEQRETFKPRSQRALRQELHQKGLSRQLIDTAVADVDEEAAARKAAEKKARSWTQLPKETFFSKMSGFLQRRGFDYAITRTVTEEVWQSEERKDSPPNEPSD
ncbi:MAG: RecX family transcriptional regulator [Candidatus Promineifilaceae bacterium]